jgi:hypothetical protein
MAEEISQEVAHDAFDLVNAAQVYQRYFGDTPVTEIYGKDLITIDQAQAIVFGQYLIEQAQEEP